MIEHNVELHPDLVLLSLLQVKSCTGGSTDFLALLVLLLGRCSLSLNRLLCVLVTVCRWWLELSMMLFSLQMSADNPASCWPQSMLGFRAAPSAVVLFRCWPQCHGWCPVWQTVVYLKSRTPGRSPLSSSSVCPEAQGAGWYWRHLRSQKKILTLPLPLSRCEWARCRRYRIAFSMPTSNWISPEHVVHGAWFWVPLAI